MLTHRRSPWRSCIQTVLTGAEPDLQVVLGVPVGVEDDAGVGGGEVDAQPAGAGAEQEDEAVRVRLAEAVDGGLPQVPPHAPIDALIQVPGRDTKFSHLRRGHRSPPL